MASSGGQVFNVTLDANMNVSGVLGAVKQMQGAFNGLKIPANLSGDILKDFNKLRDSLNKFKSISSKDVISKTDIKTLNKLQNEIDSTFSHLSNSFEELSGKTFYLDADLTKIKEARAEVKQLQEDLKNKLSETKIDFSVAKGGNVSLGIDKIVNDMEKGVKTSKILTSSMREVSNSIQVGNFEAAKNKLGEIEKKAITLKGASTGLLETFRQWGIIDFSGTAKGLVEANKHADLLHVAFQKIREGISGDEQEIKNLSSALDTAEKHVADLERLGKENFFESINEGVTATNNLGTAARGATQAEKELSAASADAVDQVRQLQQSTQYFFSLRNMINLLKRGIDEAVQSVKELDKAMTETAVVTDYKVSDLWGMLPEYTKVANQLGATTQGAYETMTLYYQQGLEQQQAFELGAETMKMARIAGLDYAETTDMMTAALRGFNMELNETSAKRVNDVYSELAAITASDTEELGTAMQRTASIAASAGASFEGTTAFLAQAIETTREPAENIGTAMKTIVARFQEMKKNPLEISEVDGEEVDYNKIDAALKTIGVDLKDTNGQFRDFDKVMLDISARWDTLSQSQQRYIATVAAGSRQQSRFIAMVSNYDRTMQLMEAANNSAGASDEQFGKTMDSLESKLNQLHNAWQQFTMGIANNGMIKMAVDGLTGFLNITNKIIDALSLGVGPIKSFLSIFTAFTGLKAAGRIANKAIGGLGGLIDPQSTFKEGFKSGIVGHSANTAQAKAISTPIVTSLSKISGQIAAIAKRQGIKDAGQKGSTAGVKETSKEEYANTKRLFEQLSGKEGFKMSDASKLFGKLDAKHQLSMFNNNPGTKTAMKKASMAWFDSKGLSEEFTNEGKLYINSIYKGMQEGQIPVDKGIELIGRPDLWGEHFATDTAKSISKHFELTDDNRKRIVDQTWSKLGMNLAAPETRAAWLKENQAEYDRMFSQIAYGHGETQSKVSDLGRLANDIGSIGDKFTQAGYGITTFGEALSQLGGPIGVVGTGIATFGGAVSSMGMMVSEATSLITVFSEGIQIAGTSIAISGGAIAAIVGPLAAAAAAFLLVRHHIKKVKEAGEEVTKTFSDASKETQNNISKLKSYQGELASLSQGVDINGNNVSLDDSQYQRYLEIVDDIATINPAIVKGYNAQGHAIIDNNTALEETVRLQQRLQKEAYKTYLRTDSLQALINARNVNTDYGKAVKNLYSTRAADAGLATNRISPLTNDVQLLADKLNISGDRKSTEYVLEKYGIESLDALIRGEEQAVKKFVSYQDQIQADLSNSGIDLGNGILEGFQTLGENTKAFDEAIKPVYDNLLALVSNSSTYKDLAPEIQSALATGLKDIASKNLNAKEMQQAASYLMGEFQTAFEKAEPYLTQADEALETFTQDLDEAAYNGKAQDIAEELRALADQAEAVGQVEIAEWYENQASRIENAITSATYSIAEGVDTLSDNIAKAKTNFEALAEGIDDYYSLSDQARGLIETALSDKNTGGYGSKTFWKTYQGLASEEAFNKHDKGTAIADMKQFQKYFTEGAEGVRAFYQTLRDTQEDSFKFTNNEGEKTTRTVGQFFKLAKDGTIEITDEFKNLSDEQYSQLAAAFKLSDDGFTAVLNNLRQWADIKFSDPGLIRKALSTDERSVTTNKKVEVEGQKDRVNRLYYGESTLKAETAELDNKDRKELVKDLQVQGSIQLPSGAGKLIKQSFDGGGEGSLLKQFVQDTRGSGNQMQNVMASLIKTNEYSKDDLEKIHGAIVERGLLPNAKDADKSFEDIYSAAELEVTDPATAAANEQLSDISSTVSTIAGIVAAGKVGEGFLPEVAKQSGALRSEIIGKEGISDTWIQRFGKGQDASGNAITDKALYNEINAKLDQYKTTNDNYINELKQGRAAAEERGASAAELKSFDDEIAAAEENSRLIALNMQNAADSWEQTQTDFYNASQTVFQGLADIRNNPNLTEEQQKTEIGNVLTGFVDTLKGWNFSPETIQSIFDKNFSDLGIKFDIENGEFASDVGEQIQQQLNNLGETEINAVLNIASIKLPGAAKGKNNTPSAIRRVGTMARGSKKRGYTINGEPTLTGELGPELVWEPRQNTAYMVGEHGPQFANLSKNAVVWNAQQTKKIKKNSRGINPLGTGARGIHSFGTMSLGVGAGGGTGTGGGLSIPGTFEINATANILDVIPPMPEPEIPVKADLQVEGGGGGNWLSKLFGGKKGGPSIDVAANITSINTGETPQSVNVIGNITQFQNTATVNDIDATATVTRVVKSEQVAGEPITVKATATTTKVENKAPTPQETTAGTQSMKVTADTSQAQAKINKLISLFNKTYTLKYKASGPSSISVPISANFTGSWKKTVEITKSGANGINNRGFGSLASGSKYGTVGPKNKGGLTLTGEKGFEIAWLPSENRSMILGANGPQMLDLPKDAVVFTNEQSKKILKQKAIPAGSHSSPNSVRGSINPAIFGGGGSSNSYAKKVVKNAKDTGDKVSKTAEDTSKAIARVLVWWDNAARRAETIQRKMDSNQNAFEKYIKNMQATLKTTGTIGKGNEYITNTQAYIAEQQRQYNKAVSELATLDSGTAKSTQKGKKKQYKNGADNILQVSYKSGKKEKTKYINTASYIDNINGTYQINQAQLNAVKNADLRKQLAEALNQEINNRISKRNAAEDAIQKAQEALEKFGEELYETFFAWEVELTKIWNITQKIEQTEAKISRIKGYQELLDSQLANGKATTNQSLDNILKAFELGVNEERENIQLNIDSLQQQRADLQRLLSSEDERTTLKAVQGKLVDSVQNSNKLSDTEFSGYQQYAKELEATIDAQTKAWQFLNVEQLLDGTLNISFDTEEFENDKLAGNITNKQGEAIQNYVKSLTDKSKELNDTYISITNGLTEMNSSLSTLQDQWTGYADELWQISEEEQKKEVDTLKKLSDSLTNSLKNLLDDVKKKLDQRRQAEDNAKTERDISQKQQRLAALRADTSGGHQVEIAQLESEIADTQQNYQRTLEDQLLDRLQQQGDLAAQQREAQIALQEATISAVNNAALVNQWMNDPAAYRNEIFEAYKTANDFDEKPKALQEDLIRKFEVMFAGLTTNQAEQETVSNTIDELTAAREVVASQLEKLVSIPNTLAIINGSIQALSINGINVDRSSADKATGTTEAAIAQAQAAQKAATSTPAPAPAPAAPSLPYGKVTKDTNDSTPNGSTKTKAVQYALNQLMGAGLAVDGKFGPKTIAAVKKFQKKYKLTQDGRVGPKTAAKFNALGYKTGGLADYTGPAWLDGTPSKPELILNAQDTKNFIALKDVLSHVMGSTNNINNTYGGNATYEININVDHINSDYDVDKITKRVKENIIKDSSYRNVTQVRKFR